MQQSLHAFCGGNLPSASSLELCSLQEGHHFCHCKPRTWLGEAMGLNGTRSSMGTKTFSAGERRAPSSTGLAQGCSLSLAVPPLPAAAAGLCMIYIHFFLVTKALKSTALKKIMFLCERLLWMIAKLSSLSPEVFLGMI